MKTPERLIIAAVLITAALLSACGAESTETAEAAEETAAEIVQTEMPRGCKALPLYLDGLLSLRAYGKDGNVYIPVTALGAKLGVSASWQGGREQFVLRLAEIEVTGINDREYFIADSRYLYAPEGWLVSGDELYLPLSAAEKLFTLIPEEEGDSASVRLITDYMAVLSGGEDYYAVNFSPEDVYWMEHIISSESRFEELDGMIAVGNVVLNRVYSDDYPDTVLKVIYDTKNAIQFEPIQSGLIHDDPHPNAVIAARICLEGYNIVGDSLFFANPNSGVSWFDEKLELTATIGNHNFYSLKEK